jgi:hypothetical protein
MPGSGCLPDGKVGGAIALCFVDVLVFSSDGAAVAFEPIESIGHGKFWYLSFPLASRHLNISAESQGDNR